jgi:hypothetical protein
MGAGYCRLVKPAAGLRRHAWDYNAPDSLFLVRHHGIHHHPGGTAQRCARHPSLYR